MYNGDALGRAFRRSAGALVMLLVTAVAGAGRAQPASDVWSRLAAQDQASGRFLQEIYSEEGELLERSSGRYAILRPGFFRWEIDYPDRQQIIIAENTLWHYDIDLATASERVIAGDEQFTALDLLARDSDDLAGRFTVETTGESSYRLVPLFSQAGFSSAELVWDGDVLVEMDVRDRSGQELQIALTPDVDPVPLAPGDFRFDPPEDVDVHRATGG